MYVDITTADDVSIDGNLTTLAGVAFGKAIIGGNVDVPFLGTLGSTDVDGSVKASTYLSIVTSLTVGGDATIGSYLSAFSLTTSGTLTAKSKFLTLQTHKPFFTSLISHPTMHSLMNLIQDM